MNNSYIVSTLPPPPPPPTVDDDVGRGVVVGNVVVDDNVEKAVDSSVNEDGGVTAAGPSLGKFRSVIG